MQDVYRTNQLIAKSHTVQLQRRRSLPEIPNNTVKFEINMADERSSVDGSFSSQSHGAGGDAANGSVGDPDDGHLICSSRRRPFLIGVAGGTASGKV